MLIKRFLYVNYSRGKKVPQILFKTVDAIRNSNLKLYIHQAASGDMKVSGKR